MDEIDKALEDFKPTQFTDEEIANYKKDMLQIAIVAKIAEEGGRLQIAYTAASMRTVAYRAAEAFARLQEARSELKRRGLHLVHVTEEPIVSPEGPTNETA